MKAILVLLLTLMVVGCKVRQPEEGSAYEPQTAGYFDDDGYNLYVRTVRGHEYIIAESPSSDGICIIHAAHCQCMQKVKP